MKIALFLIMCSAVANECMPPHYFGEHNDYYDCFDAGYTESSPLILHFIFDFFRSPGG